MKGKNASKDITHRKHTTYRPSLKPELVKGFLKKVIALKKQDVAAARGEIPLSRVRKRAEKYISDSKMNFLEAVNMGAPGHVGVIAEIKKASPSKGDIKIDLDPGKYARKYTEAGACAISILTEQHFFKGSIDDLTAVRKTTNLPLLRKDFTLSSYQIYEARAAGADSVLLITSILTREQLRDYTLLARELGMEPLVEIHSEWELEKAVFADARAIGINNRNLQTLETDLGVAERVVPFFSNDQIPVEASGISSSKDIRKGLNAGICNFLVGESIVRAEDTIEFIQSLINTDTLPENSKIPDENQKSESRKHRPWVKICGLTNPFEAKKCADLGADAIGLVFYPPSPRSVTPEQAVLIARALPPHVPAIGVFVDETFEFIMQIVEACSLKGIQLHGKESPELVKKLKATGLMVIKALFSSRAPGLNQGKYYRDASALLVEGGKGVLPGGNAETWHWKLPDGAGSDRKIIVAGGLGTYNVKDAINQTNPWGVDVSSGVESSPGHKDIPKVAEFISALKE